MKRLALLILTVGILFVSGTISQAATVTFGGELNLGYNLEPGFLGPDTLGGYPTDMKLNAQITVSDQVSGNVLLEAKNYGAATTTATDPAPAYPYIDQAFITYNPGFATFRAGRFAVNVKDNVSILNGMLYNGDYKDGFALQILFPVAGNLSARAWVAVPQSLNYNYNSSALTPVLSQNNETRGDYAVTLAYNGAIYGGSVNALSIAQDNYFPYANGWGSAVTAENKGYALLDGIVTINLYIMPGPAVKLYYQYGEGHANWRSSDASHTNSGSDKLRSNIFGISFDSPDIPVYFRAEYDFENGLSGQGVFPPFGYLFGYKFGHGLSWEYQRLQFADDKYDAGANNYNRNYFRFILVF